MALKKPKTSRSSIFAGLLVAGVVLLLLPQSVTNGLNFLFARVFNPVLSIGRSTDPEIFKPASSDFVPRAEYNRLQAAYDNVRAALITEHERYEKLAGIKSALPRPGPKLVLAEVMNTSIGGLRRELIINKGDVDGLRPGQYVLGGNGIIGTVSETSEATARVRLVTDASHKIKVAIWQSDKKRYIYARMDGNGSDSAKIPFISREYKIGTGDTVYAAAVAGFLESPIVIGRITQVEADEKEPLLWDITVEPAQNAELLKRVAVIVADP
ncbi:MAG TPA: rod shape-determining protein MreC [Planctomycetes bacterium]|nr:rod shape-determining protein MreC [Planctomycetota bacterium]HIJ70163.1 rod shape-determining protein MreC [Planctomycetota bacterium]